MRKIEIIPTSERDGECVRSGALSTINYPTVSFRSNAFSGLGRESRSSVSRPPLLPSQGRKREKIKTQAPQDAILHSAYFSSIATGEKGAIQTFNIGAERMLGYAASDVIDQITPADISDPKELIARAAELSPELGAWLGSVVRDG